MKETPFLGYVIDTARRFRWRAWHVPMPVQRVRGGGYVPDPRGAGIPDLILMHADPPRLIFAEVKGTGGTLTDAQREFLGLARSVAAAAVESPGYLPLTAAAARPVGVYVWAPGMEQQIEDVLRSRVMFP